MTDFVVYTKRRFACRFCNLACYALRKAGHNFTRVALADDALLSMSASAEMTTVPIIFHGPNLVGGYEDLLAYLETLENTDNA